MKSKMIFSKVISVILCLLIMTSMIPAGVICAVAETDSDVLLEVGSIVYSGWTSGTKNEYTVETNQTGGDVTIVFTPKNNNWQREGNNLLSVNGVSVVKTCGEGYNSRGYYLGATAVKTDAANAITVVITPSTGAAAISDAAGNTGSANVGVIGNSFEMVVNQDQNNGWELTSIVVTQLKAASGDSSDALYTNNFDSAEDVARGVCGDTSVAFNADKSALLITHNNWNYTKAYWETSVNLNRTDGMITLKTTIDSDATQDVEGRATGAILTVNGKVIIQNGIGERRVILGDGTEIKGCAGGFIEDVTLVIDPKTGSATLTFEQAAANAVDGSFPKTTVVDGIELGAIGETLSVLYGTNRHANFYVYSLSVTQESGGEVGTHTCEFTTTITKATCISPEFTKKTCEGCGASTETVTAPVLGHTWGAWSKSDNIATRSCVACREVQSKSVGTVNTEKAFLAIGDSLTYGLNVSGTINGAWAKYVSDSLGFGTYQNYAVHGTEVYQWYSLLTGENAPNGKSTSEIGGLTKDALTEAIRNAGIVAFSLESNDMIGGYVGFRSAEKVHETLVKFIDAIHLINPDAVVVSIGYAYGVSMVPGGVYAESYQLFIDFNELMNETLNSEAYNGFAYYVDVSNVMSDASLLGADKVHPTADGQKQIADDVISALGSIADEVAGKNDTVTWESIPSYTNKFDGTAPAASIVSWGEKGTNGVLTVDPATNKNANQLGVGSSAFPGKAIITFKFNIPKLPESGSINIFHDRTLEQNYVCVFPKVNEETQNTEFFASVGNQNEGNSAVRIEENTWYNVTILFAENSSSYSKVYIGNTLVGTVRGDTIGRQAGWGFANFCGCSGGGEQNAAAYQIDDFTASTVADDSLVHAYGIQKTEAIEMKYDVRFILSVDDIYTGESAIGIDIAASYGEENSARKSYDTNVVFEQIFENYGEDTISAAMLGGKYIAAIIVEDVPADYDSVEFTVTPYAVIDGVKYYSKTMTATVYPE